MKALTQKTFKPTEDMIKSAELVFAAKSIVETIKPIVHAYQYEILNRHQFKNTFDGSIVLDNENIYELSEEDFAIYSAEVKAARDKAGLHVDNDDYCPLLVAEDNLRKAQRLLANAMEPITKLSADDVICSASGLDNYKKYIELSLGLLAPYVNKESILSYA